MACAIVSIGVSQVKKQDPGKPLGAPGEIDGWLVFKGAIESGIKELAKAFEMKDAHEIAFFSSGFDALKDLRLEKGSILSVVILRRGDRDNLSKAYEERFGDTFVIRFRRATIPSMNAPIAIVTNTYLLNGRAAVHEQMLRFDEKSMKWRNSQNDR
jgi:hypothetical protein